MIILTSSVELQKDGTYFALATTVIKSGIFTEKYFVVKLIEAGAVAALLNLLFEKDQIVLKNTFDCLYNIGVTFEEVINQKCKDFDKLRQRCNGLRYHKKRWIRIASRAFLNKYINEK